MRINLLKETTYAITKYDKTWEDVSWIGSYDFYVSITDFIESAENTNYDNGYGSQEVARDLIIYFKDGSWLSRAEYDGSEWWKYNTCPQKPREKFYGNLKLASNAWDNSLYGINYPHD